jgi:signal transduction histidine kinase
LQTEFKKPLLTQTVKRFLLWNVGIFLLILLAFNLFILVITDFVLEKNLDDLIKHEVENIVKTIEVKNDSLILISNRELEESDLKEIRETSFFLQIIDLDGRILIASDNLKSFGEIPFDIKYPLDDYSFHNINSPSKKLSAGYHKFINSDGKIIAHMQLSVFKSGTNVILYEVLLFNLLSLPVVLLLILIASIFLAKIMLAPINNVIQTAGKISTRNLSERIRYKASPEDEIGRLRDTLNNLFERLEQQVNQISQFSDHASHQLMNPLTIIISELEYILRKDRTSEDYKNSFEQIKTQVEKMIKIINHLFIISKYQDEQAINKSIFNLSNFIAEEINKTFSDKKIALNIQPDIYARGNSEVFSIVVENLMDNAIKYSDTKLVINVSLKLNHKTIEFAVSDTGIGIADIDKERVFQKFFRTDKVEKLGIKGFGLGLSVVKSIIAQMNGTIMVEDNKPHGSIFTVRLPAVEID